MSVDIKRKVNQLVRLFGTRDPFEMIKGMDVILVFYPLDGVRGFYQYFKRNNIIYIDESLSRHDQQFVCAHELGHMFLHKRSNALFMDTRTQFNTSRYELEADKFAVNLLISDSVLREYPDYSTDQLSRLFGYSKKLIELRLK